MANSDIGYMEGYYPQTRLRRNRKAPWLRELVAETSLSARDLIWPVFVHESSESAIPVSSMPGVSTYSIKQLVEEVKEARDLGITAIDLFPSLDADVKDELGTEGYRPGNLVCRAIEAIKSEIEDIGVICDVALDPYTNHGHDGTLENGYVANDKTCELLVKQALLFAQSGADIIAPSDMMDGRVKFIREALDHAKLENVGIIAYCAKYASNFYGPFRDAAKSKQMLKGSDKKTYQMDFRNKKEALREARQDIMEGADMLLVKPGLPYLDIVNEFSRNFDLPILVYQVSGEYSMIKAAAQNGWLNESQAFLETATACKRAGASGIFTYYAKELAILLKH